MSKSAAGESSLVPSTPVETTEYRSLQTVVTDMVAAVNAEVQALTVHDQDSNNQADLLLKRISDTTKYVDSEFEPFIRPRQQLLAEIYETKRDFTKPLETATLAIKEQMRQWQLAERKRIAEIERQKQAEITRLAREAEKARQRAEAAKTPVTANKHAEVASVLERRAEQAVSIPTPVIAKTQHTSAREYKRVEITSKEEFIAAVAADIIPLEMVDINMTAVERVFRYTPEQVLHWPGTEIVDDIAIAGKGGRKT